MALERFVAAQHDAWPSVVRELKSGRKRTHWMWFVFPQLKAPGRSPTSEFYGLDGLAEARAYMRHALLGPRLKEATALVRIAPCRDAVDLFGAVDALKFRSCMTLFSEATEHRGPFVDALDRFYAGEPDALTLRLMKRA